MIQNAYVGLGSNLGDRAGVSAARRSRNARRRVWMLFDSRAFTKLSQSNHEDQPAFLNLVAEVRGSTLPAPDQMMARLLRIEYALGRTRDVANRTTHD